MGYCPPWNSEMVRKIVGMLCGKRQHKSIDNKKYENKKIRGVSLQLISSVRCEPEGKLGKAAYLEKWVTKITSVTAGDAAFNITFDWDESMGDPGAFVIRNHHHSQFYLKTVTLEDFPGHGRVHFVCNSWVYPAHRYKYNRVFFANKVFPNNLRRNGSGVLKEWDRVYDYACYNDLGSPDKGPEHARPVLGGSKEYPSS